MSAEVKLTRSQLQFHEWLMKQPDWFSSQSKSAGLAARNVTLELSRHDPTKADVVFHFRIYYKPGKTCEACGHEVGAVSQQVRVTWKYWRKKISISVSYGTAVRKRPGWELTLAELMRQVEKAVAGS